MAYSFRGLPIFKLRTFEQLCSNLTTLISNGYQESYRKPALFYRKGVENEIYFADMRGTEIIPMWSDPAPLFYAKFPIEIPFWKRSRLATAEYRRLKVCRLSNEFDADEYAISVPELGIWMSNGSAGYCDQCGKDFEGDGCYCSLECADLADELHSPHCKICNKRLDWDSGDRHHLNYADGITILVCRSCHLKIHRGTSLELYKPVDKRLIPLVKG